MEQLFLPFSGNLPATIEINGHRLLLLSHDRSQLEDHLDLLNAESVCAVADDESVDVEAAVLGAAQASHADVIITPEDIEMPEFLEALKNTIPWTQ